jgi:hypothetical protein
MKLFKLIIVTTVFIFLSISCGVEGDPGYCYFSLDWEYYNEDYGVYYYEDNNPDIPGFGESKEGFGKSNPYFSVNKSEGTNSEELVAGNYYESYPGKYNYVYESRDSLNHYQHFGFYELQQNPGTTAGFMYDGLDGADTHKDLYLYIYARKGLRVVEEVQVLEGDISAAIMEGNGGAMPSSESRMDIARSFSMN